MEVTPVSYPEPVPEFHANQPTGVQSFYDQKDGVSAYHAASTQPPYNYNIPNNNGPPNNASYNEKQPPSNLLCGIRRTTFWLSVVLAVVILIAIVGGTAGGIAAKNAGEKQAMATLTSAKPSGTAASDVSTPSSISALKNAATKTIVSTLVSSTTATATKFATTATPSSGCPESNGTTYNGAGGSEFEITCNLNFPSNDLLAGPMPLVSMDSCMDLCFKWNQTKSSDAKGCIGVIFGVSNPDSGQLQQKWDAGQCYLKSGLQGSGSFDITAVSGNVVKSGQNSS